MNTIRFRACMASLLLALAPASFAQRAATPSVAVGEPDPNARRLPSHPAQGQQADALFAAWDRNHDGQLSPTEFRDGLQRARGGARAQASLRHQFDALDANHNGAIDPGEYGKLELVKRAGKSAPALPAYDGNHDGRLDFAEYVKLVEALAQQQARADK